MKSRIAAFLASMLAYAGCSRSNDILFGRVEAPLGSHTVVVTDCYRTSVPPPQKIEGPDGSVKYNFTPCKDAAVVLDREELFVNGKSYGHLGAAVGVLVDHGVVSIQKAGN